MRIFTEAEIRQAVQLDDQKIIQQIESAFTHLASGKCVMPPIMRMDIEEHKGEVDVKSAYLANDKYITIKISSGFFQNKYKGLPSASGMMLLIDAQTGIPEAIFLDNGYLTDVRTGAAGAVAAKYLSKVESRVIGVVGAGTQARFQLRALKLVRDFEQVYVFSPTSKKSMAFAEEIRSLLAVEVFVAQSIAELMKKSDIVVTTTPAQKPIIYAEWLHAGLHLTAMGSDAEHKQELESEIFQHVDRIVCDDRSQCFRLGELLHGREKGIITDQHQITSLGEITNRSKSGRINDQEITLCDLTGTGVQDTAIAQYAYEKLLALGLGTAWRS